MLKQDLEIELEKAQKDIKEWETINNDRKKAISRVLGFYREAEGFYGNDKGVILDWYGIFFEIGKLYQRANTDRSILDVQEQVKHLMACEEQRRKDAEKAEKEGVK